MAAQQEVEQKELKTKEVELLNLQLEIILREWARAHDIREPEHFKKKVIAVINVLVDFEKKPYVLSILASNIAGIFCCNFYILLLR
ncbi:MAG: hypothetical protein AAB795_03375 [Patescibacteria group bacterium]